MIQAIDHKAEFYTLITGDHGGQLQSRSAEIVSAGLCRSCGRSAVIDHTGECVECVDKLREE